MKSKFKMLTISFSFGIILMTGSLVGCSDNNVKSKIEIPFKEGTVKLTKNQRYVKINATHQFLTCRSVTITREGDKVVGSRCFTSSDQSVSPSSRMYFPKKDNLFLIVNGTFSNRSFYYSHIYLADLYVTDSIEE
jgi:hypothetical protein